MNLGHLAGSAPEWRAHPPECACLWRRTGKPVRVGVAILLALAVANCSSTKVANRKTREVDPRYGVAPSPRVIPEGEPIPKGGGRQMVGQPYVVGGRTYVPTPGKGYSREGWASWYGTAFHGRLTANGEVFDRQSIAAAHPTLPLPSYVRVTNLFNKRSMIVRVNDRGPYEQSRIIDVSERVADALDFRRKGTTRVQVEYVGKASTRGSDDEKLLASLRTDGSPAPFGRARGPTMLADLREDPPRRTLRAQAAYKTAELAPGRSRVAPQGNDEEDGEDAEPIRPALRPVHTAFASPPAAAASVPPNRENALPPLRPSEMARPQAPALSGPTRAAATVELLPPQRPMLAGIY